HIHFCSRCCAQSAPRQRATADRCRAREGRQAVIGVVETPGGGVQSKSETPWSRDHPVQLRIIFFLPLFSLETQRRSEGKLALCLSPTKEGPSVRPGKRRPGASPAPLRRVIPYSSKRPYKNRPVAAAGET